jgi:hypothetical protein
MLSLVRERERDKGRDKEKERGRERDLFKAMTGALAPFSYLFMKYNRLCFGYIQQYDFRFNLLIFF